VPGLDLAAIYNGNDPFIGREFNGSGAGLGTRSFDGSIEQLAPFDYALTDAQILQQYNANVPEPDTLALLGVSLGGVLFSGRRKRRSRAYTLRCS
jgi:hypothetical protein